VWSVWPERKSAVELVIAENAWWRLSARGADRAQGDGGPEEALASLSKLPKRTPVQVWLTGALLPVAVVDPPSEIETREWPDWLQYMARKNFSAETGAPEDWVIWCEAGKPQASRLIGMRKVLWDSVMVGCAKQKLKRIAPLWALLEESCEPYPADTSSVTAFDGERAHVMRSAPGRPCHAQ
jgi:hypothetical protein